VRIRGVSDVKISVGHRRQVEIWRMRFRLDIAERQEGERMLGMMSQRGSNGGDTLVGSGVSYWRAVAQLSKVRAMTS
jgi:hypothetical protein